jgi:hypothetical protein
MPRQPHPPSRKRLHPFSDWDWTWLNGNPRNKDVAFDSKFFTPEIRADITYNYDFNKPIDNSIGGSSEIFRANEIQLEQLGIGGDFHLRQRSRPVHDSIWQLFRNHATQRSQPGEGPVGPRHCRSLYRRGLWWLPH